MLGRLTEDSGIWVARNKLHFGQMEGKAVKRGEIKPRALLFGMQLALCRRFGTAIEGITHNGDLMDGGVGADLVRTEKIDAGFPERPAFRRFGDPPELGEAFLPFAVEGIIFGFTLC